MTEFVSSSVPASGPGAGTGAGEASSSFELANQTYKFILFASVISRRHLSCVSVGSKLTYWLVGTCRYLSILLVDALIKTKIFICKHYFIEQHYFGLSELFFCLFLSIIGYVPTSNRDFIIVRNVSFMIFFYVSKVPTLPTENLIQFIKHLSYRNINVLKK